MFAQTCDQLAYCTIFIPCQRCTRSAKQPRKIFGEAGDMTRSADFLDCGYHRTGWRQKQLMVASKLSTLVQSCSAVLRICVLQLSTSSESRLSIMLAPADGVGRALSSQKRCPQALPNASLCRLSVSTCLIHRLVLSHLKTGPGLCANVFLALSVWLESHM